MTVSVERNKNILFVTPYMETGGTEKVVYDLVRGLLSHGCHVYVASSGGRFVAELEKLGVNHFEIKALNSKSPFKLLTTARAIQQLVKACDIDIINTHSYVAAVSVFLSSLLSRTKFKHLFTLHIPEKDIYFKVMGVTLNFLVDKTITVCKWTRDRLVKSGVNNNMVDVIYNGVDTTYFSKNSQEPEKKPHDIFHIGVVARLVGRKGHYILLRAVKRYTDECSSQQLCVHFYGDGPIKSELRDRVSELGLEKIVIFHGDTVDVRAAYQSLDLFVLPSYTEGFPLTILEAMSARVPVVATSVNGIPEAVINGKTGFTFGPGRHEDLFYILKQLIGHPKQLQDLANNAYRQVRERFDTKVMVGSYLHLFSKV